MDYPSPCSERMGGAKEADLKFNMQALTAFRQSDGKIHVLTAYYTTLISIWGVWSSRINDTILRS